MTSVAIDPPLTRWYCDECDKPIDDPKWATVCWDDPTSSTPVDDRLQYDFPSKFFIVHKGNCDDMRNWPKSHDLSLLLGTEGMQWWAGHLWRGPESDSMIFVPGVDPKPVMELFYRLYIPVYEQARRYFNSEDAAYTLSEHAVLSESLLRKIIEKSSD